jgi:hypothetical protein
MPTFDRINFSIRPNKNVERKLIFEALAALEPLFPFAQYQYVGFGSMWFADFLLAHRVLGITQMTSIQYDTEFAQRARFNAPHSCIKVEEGDSSVVLPGLPLERGPALLWLDYESTIDQLLDELGRLCARLVSGSVLVVTANAVKERVNVSDEASRRQRQEESFRAAVGDLAPAVFTPDFFDAGKYPANVASTLVNHLTHATRVAGRDERFVPIFNFSYKDNAPMVTVGGMIANAADRERLRRAALNARLPFVQAPEQTVIAMPPLTTREKLALDQLFPAQEAPSEEEIAKLGFKLKRSYIEAYHRYYSRYPVFGEVLP